MNGPSADTTDDQRIAIANLDAVEQTRLWLALGAERATTTLLAALRTALLLSETVVLDRNQVLEGIFFIAMPPERLAWHLGIEPSAPLPLTVALIDPGTDTSATQEEGPWPLSAERAWAVDENMARTLDLNFHAVAGDPLRVSSPLLALSGTYDGSAASSHTSVNSPARGRDWERSDPSFLPQRLWDLHHDGLNRHVIDAGRRAWLRAMKNGQVAVEPWQRDPISIGEALERARVTDPAVADLAEMIVRLEQPEGHTTVCSVRHGGSGGAEGPCGRRHVTKRSLIVRWLDGAETNQLVPAKIPDMFLGAEAYHLRETAFRWWNAAYYDAICERDGLRMLTLHNSSETIETVSADSAVPGRVEELELAWGLRRPRPRRADVLKRRMRRFRPSPGQRDIEIEGEMTQHLARFSPHQFAEIRGRGLVRSHADWTAPGQLTLFDLALAVREMAGDNTPRLHRTRNALIKAVVLGVLLSALAFKEHYGWGTGWWNWAWLALALVAAFPWGEFADWFKMTPSGLQSTVRMRPHR